MTLNDWLNLFRQSRIWLLLLCVNNAFFIFLAWLAYPNTFMLLLGLMLTITAVSIILGLLLIRKGQLKQEQAFYKFLKEPSSKNEATFSGLVGKIHKDKIYDLAKKLRLLYDKSNEAKLQALEYEEFIEGWTHELKTPLSLVNFVLHNRKDEMSELVYQRFEYAKINISDHVERILFYARLQGAHVDYKLKKISIKDCLEDVLLELQLLLDEHHVNVKLQIEDISVISDERSLQFIITQILVNAVKYRNEEIDSCIWLTTGFNRAKNCYYVRMFDNGIGVLDSDLPFIFDKGFTGENTNRKQSTGIGLYLVKKLCDQLRGEIEVESNYGESFDIQLLFPKFEKH